MKIGTDAILLGCSVNIDEDESILDVGTGCGIIALMLAQRTKGASITGLDIDRYAYREAELNFNNSPWKNRLKVIQTSFQDFSIDTYDKFDHIVSNPPFFEGDRKSIYPSRTKSRHTVYLSHDDFIRSAAKISHDRTKLTVILPIELTENFNHLAATEGFILKKQIRIHPKPKRPANRAILGFVRKQGLMTKDKLVIYDEAGNYTSDYVKLTSDFYL